MRASIPIIKYDSRRAHQVENKKGGSRSDRLYDVIKGQEFFGWRIGSIPPFPPLFLDLYLDLYDVIKEQEFLELRTGSIPPFPPPLSLETDNPWVEPVKLGEVCNIIRGSMSGPIDATISPEFTLPMRPEIEWPIVNKIIYFTETEIFPICNRLSEETEEFVQKFGLQEGVKWLQREVPTFFPGTDFEIDFLPEEDEEESMLALRLYGSLSAAEFREQRHLMCEAMLGAGYKNLYNVISVFQRRMHNHGWQGLPFNSPVFAA